MTSRKFASAEEQGKLSYVVRDLSTILRERTITKVKPGAAKVAPVRVAPKHAEKPVE
jgi:hypothetical protein